MTQSQKSVQQALPEGTVVRVGPDGLEALVALLKQVGYTTIGPTVKDDAVVYQEINTTKDFPIGWADDQDGGTYRLVQGTKGAFFDYLVGPTSPKRYFFPPQNKLWGASKEQGHFEVEKPAEEAPSYAFIGVRSCELRAIIVQDRVFGFAREDQHDKGIFSDPYYVERRKKSLIIAVNCRRAGKTCFCVSMGGDPHVRHGEGFDLALTEIMEGSQHHFLIEVGSERGGLILALLPFEAAKDQDLVARKTQAEKARGQMGRTMVADVNPLLKNNLTHSRWEDVASRCLSCANCTMVCPTCFCSNVEERTDLTGDHTERWRTWDSCFSIDYSYIHGGPIRKETKSRYRQWMTHKLSSWWDQFGLSGCVGCGRCITWCPVGIDITQEAAAIKKSEECQT